MNDRWRRARRIGWHASYTCFKPCGVRGRCLSTVTLQADGLKRCGSSISKARIRMNAHNGWGSRETLSRTVEQARSKVAEALLCGKTLLIDAPDPSMSVANEAYSYGVHAKQHRGHHMKIAVASQNRRTITEHAGRCRKFWIYRIIEDQVRDKRMLELPKEQSFHDSPRNAPHPLDTVNVLISSGMGRGLERRLRDRGIEALVTSETDPDNAVKAYLAGTLERRELGCDDHQHPV